jgi:hypothetical protein
MVTEAGTEACAGRLLTSSMVTSVKGCAASVMENAALPPSGATRPLDGLNVMPAVSSSRLVTATSVGSIAA